MNTAIAKIHASKVWIIDDDRSIRWVLEKALQQAGIETRCFENGDDAVVALGHEHPDVLISDIRMPGSSGLVLLDKIHARYPHIPVIIITAHSDLESAVASFQGGAFEYLPKPFDIDDAVTITRRALSAARELASQKIARSELALEDTRASSTDIIGEAPAMQEVFRAIGRLSFSNITVLINGESGTGKELVARALHRHSPRKSKPFIALNMAAIPKDLMESELFGHEKGSFTGATTQRQGRFEQANGGTLFLDEIGDMPPDTQTRLLRVLSDGEFYRVGGQAPVKVDVRIIAATHQNLEQLVKENRFREDLFHRLNVIRVHIPRLAERREDIPKLIQLFFQKASEELHSESKVLLPETEKFLCSLDWPGNVRQLENLCRWLTVMAPGHEVHLADLPPELKSPASSSEKMDGSTWECLLRSWADQELAKGHVNLLGLAVPVFEKIMIESALKFTGGRRKEAADLLGWGRNTLTRKISELGMSADESSDNKRDEQ